MFTNERGEDLDDRGVVLWRDPHDALQRIDPTDLLDWLVGGDLSDGLGVPVGDLPFAGLVPSAVGVEDFDHGQAAGGECHHGGADPGDGGRHGWRQLVVEVLVIDPPGNTPQCRARGGDPGERGRSCDCLGAGCQCCRRLVA
ncbi:hypothetical protein [Streptomyces sp. NPDC101234]|uniref:hypothetical protein n=1 Tax=Streptomyces sp. NPDC101234 TaxID=3366138 RepID=UPI0037F2122D